MNTNLFITIINQNMATIKTTIHNILSPVFKKNLFYPLETVSYSTKLGRWKIENNNKLVHCKIDQANEDHCGCCVNEFKTEVKVDDSIDKKNEEYLIPYCM